MQKFNAPAADAEIRLTRVDPVAAPEGKRSRRAGGALVRRHIDFIGLVILPTLLAAIYFLGMAADRYELQTQYVIRAPSAPVGGALSALVQSDGAFRSVDDAYITHAYIQSRNAMQELLEKIELPALFGRPKLDLLWQYPPPFLKHSEERLYRRLQSHVNVTFDRTTGITTLRVQAFAPEDSRAIASALLANAERLVNRLSERGQHDAVATAETNVTMDRKAAIAAQERITEFRRRNSVIDPGKVSASSHETIARLALESAQIEAQVMATQRSSPSSPQIETDKGRIAALESQILKERQRLAGTDASLAPLIAEYETLVLERQFAEQAFGSSLTALEVARAHGLRQRLFLEQISPPHLPDYAAYPYRILGIIVVFALSWAAFSILKRLVLDARHHAEI